MSSTIRSSVPGAPPRLLRKQDPDDGRFFYVGVPGVKGAVIKAHRDAPGRGGENGE